MEILSMLNKTNIMQFYYDNIFYPQQSYITLFWIFFVIFMFGIAYFLFQAYGQVTGEKMKYSVIGLGLLHVFANIFFLVYCTDMDYRDLIEYAKNKKGQFYQEAHDCLLKAKEEIPINTKFHNRMYVNADVKICFYQGIQAKVNDAISYSEEEISNAFKQVQGTITTPEVNPKPEINSKNIKK